MKINGNFFPLINGVNNANRVNRTEKEAGIKGSDQTNVSDKAQFMNTLIQEVKDLPPVREEKVKEISEQIAAGTYVIDAAAIAAKLSIKDLK
jgi:negative regulator of flagellin synthesis FlgM